METGVPVKNETENLNNYEFISRPKITVKETLLGSGEQYFPIFFLLYWSNAMVYAHRFNYHKSYKAFFLSFPLTYVLTKASCYLMGDSMYRIATKLESESLGSAKLWEKKFGENKNDEIKN